MSNHKNENWSFLNQLLESYVDEAISDLKPRPASEVASEVIAHMSSKDIRNVQLAMNTMDLDKVRKALDEPLRSAVQNIDDIAWDIPYYNKVKEKMILQLTSRLRQIRKPDIQQESALNVGLDLAGLIPGIGEFADAANALLYAAKGDYLLAGLSLVSTIPALGDVVGKGGKVAIWLEKLSPKLAKNVTKYAPKVAETINVLKKLIVDNKNLIKQVFSAIEQQAEQNDIAKKMAPHLKRIWEALDVFARSAPAAPEAAAASATTQPVAESAKYRRRATAKGKTAGHKR